MNVVNINKKSDNAEQAINHICQQDEIFGRLVKRMSVTRAVQKMLTDGGYNLEKLHKEGDLRIILSAFLS